MVSGVETAGLVLAAFPIIVDGLNRWAKGVETMRRWRKIRRELESYALRLQNQKVTYLDTLEQLLVGIVQSNEEMAAMLAEPGGTIWQSQVYDQNLQNRLDRSYEPFRATLTHMNMALKDLEKSVGIETTGNVSCYLPPVNNREPAYLFYLQVVWDDWSFIEREMKRIKITLSKDSCAEKLDAIDRSNFFLRQCISQNLRLEPSRRKFRAEKISRDLQIIKKHATSLFNAMVKGECWKCRCKDFHVASLRLETRHRPIERSRARFRVRILLSKNQLERDQLVCSEWRELEVESHELIITQQHSTSHESVSRMAVTSTTCQIR